MLHPAVIDYSPLTKTFTTLFGQLLIPLISLASIFVLAIVVKLFIQAAENKQLVRSGIQEIDRMGGRMFERYLAVVFRQHGFQVELTRASKDQGADLVLVKNNVRTVVQAKRWKGHVGNRAVQEAAAANDVILWNRTQLIKELLQADVKQKVAATVSTVVEPTEKHRCPRCQKTLVLKTNKNKEKFWGCSGFSHCRYTIS